MSDPEWNFTYERNRRFEVLAEYENRQWLRKWGFDEHHLLKSYTFDNPYRRGDGEAFLKSFFFSEAFHETFASSHMSFPTLDKVRCVGFTELTCSEASMDLFLPLEHAPEVVRADGQLVRMMDVWLTSNDPVSDQFRGAFMLLPEESEYANVISETSKRQFLYHVMWRLVAGGRMNQYEEHIAPYKELCRAMYKDLVCVGKDASGERVEVLSHVFQVFTINEEVDAPLFQADSVDRTLENSNFSFMYIIVNPPRREVIMWSYPR